MKLKEVLKQYLPSCLLSIFRNIRLFSINVVYKIVLLVLPFYYKAREKQLRNRTQLNIVFFLTHYADWKFEYLYRFMEKDPFFNPSIVLVPVNDFGREDPQVEMIRSYSILHAKGYKVIKAYDFETKEYLDVKKQFLPDIVFYSCPYASLIDNMFYITKYLSCLPCYVSYNYGNSSDFKTFHNLHFHNYAWKIFCESDFHMRYSIKYADNKGVNCVVTGYPAIDVYLDKSYKPNDPWKNNDLKRIIWAPHHSMNTNSSLCYSCFLLYYDFMLDMAVKYQDKIQIAFKPHPLLRPYLNNIWGKEKTDLYFLKWEMLPNTFYTEGDYVDLFLTSDAMIHDCGSFIFEYLYTLKPVMRTENSEDIYSQFNSLACKCLDVHYHAYNELDIENFIVDIINENDKLYDERTLFYKDFLIPSKGTYASLNIINYIKSRFQTEKASI